MQLWVMPDRALPRSLRMIEGFGVHTFRLVNAAGESRFVKFHWTPLAGTHSEKLMQPESPPPRGWVRGPAQEVPNP